MTTFLLVAFCFFILYWLYKRGASKDLSGQKNTHSIELSDGTIIKAQVKDRNQHLVSKYGNFFNSTIKPILVEAFEGGSLDKRKMERKFRNTVQTFYNNQNLLEGYKQSEFVDEVEVMAVDDERTCDHCKHHHGNTFPVEKAPTIPHHNCANLKSGDTTDSCRCVLNSSGL